MEAVPVNRLVRGGAGALHDRPIESAARVDVLEIERAAVVLGSTQSFDVVDPAVAADVGFDVVRRRSGGGVVVLQPGNHAWVDVTVPRGHQRWDDDVERATWWVGDAWCAALSEIDSSAEWVVFMDKLVADSEARAVCFASLGPGEVARRETDGALRKVVGISQRRTRDAARFQCTVFGRIDLPLHERLLRGPVPPSLRSATGVGGLLDDVARRAVELLRIGLAG